MLTSDPHITSASSLPGVRVLDAAKGVIVALRGCTMVEAFLEILDVTKKYGAGPLAISDALVTLAEGRPLHHVDPVAAEAARREWASLLPRRDQSKAR